MDLSKLADGQVVTYRIGRAGESAVIWLQWATGTLYVQRRDKAFRRGREVHPKGEIVTLTIKDAVCAEYREQDYDPAFDMWLVEDWYLQIKKAS